MKIFIIITIIIILAFCVILLLGMISAAIVGRTKKRQMHANEMLSQLPGDVKDVLVEILSAYKKNHVEKINGIIGRIGVDKLNQLLDLLSPKNRPKEFSAGESGDSLSWSTTETALQDRGYTINSSKIITGLILYNINDILSGTKQNGGVRS